MKTQQYFLADHAVVINTPLSFSLAPGTLHFARASAAESQFAIRSTSLIRIEAVFTTVGGDLLAQSDVTNLLSIINGMHIISWLRTIEY
jgi:hypothetical protein